MDWTEETRCAYVAALLDGEGCLGIKKRRPSSANRMSAPKYAPHVTVFMGDLPSVQFFADFCGPHARIEIRRRKDCAVMYLCSIENGNAAVLLRRVYPYLVSKKWQADLVIAMAELRATSRQHRTKVLRHSVFAGGARKGVAYRHFGLSDEFLARCEVLYVASRKRITAELVLS